MKVVLALILLAGSAAASDYNFCWRGSNDYTVTGRMTVPEAAMTKEIVTAEDITRFKIAGYHQGRLIGTWSLDDKTDTTTWVLNFDPTTSSFLMGGSFPGNYSQGWNANGDVADCGNPGFGFNAGNYAQDVCMNGVWIEASGVDPATPLSAGPDPVTPDCRAAEFTSKRR